MLSQLVFSKLIQKNSKLELKRASFYKYAEIQQLFRFLLIGFELILILNLKSDNNYRLLLISLFLYLCIVSATIFFQHFWNPLRRLQSEKMCFVDIVFYTLFLVSGSEISHIFYLNFLIVPFCLSLKKGIRQTFPYLILTFFILIGVGAKESIQNNFENITNPIFWSGFIFILGYFFARWGNAVYLERRKIDFFNRIQNFIKPNTGINVACDFILSELLDFFAAKSCSILILEAGDECTLRSIERLNNQKKIGVKVLDHSEINNLKLGNLDSAIIYSKNGMEEKVFEYSDNQWREHGAGKIYCELARSQSSNSFIAVSLKSSNEVFGRLFVYSDSDPFTLDDVIFLTRMVDGITIYLDHLKLTGKISSDAAELERHRIALDIHDSIIQPYIALQLGITSLRYKLHEQQTITSYDVDRLYELTQSGIVDLRNYTRGLKNGNGNEPAFFPALERFIGKFSEATGIQIIFDYEKSIGTVLEGRLSAALFQMICEGLSNVRKHTQSKRIWLSLNLTGKFISLMIENEGAIVENKQLFLPKSLAQRTALHGGVVSVIPKPAGGVAIQIEIPVLD